MRAIPIRSRPRRAFNADRTASAPPLSALLPEAFRLDDHVFFWLTEVMGRRNRLLAPALRRYGLRVPEWRVLASLRGRERASSKELAELASFDQTTLSRTIDRFVRDGLVVRFVDIDDLRVTRLALTAKGEKLFAEVWPAVAELNTAALARLPEGGAAMLRWLLREMRTSLDEMIETRRVPRQMPRADEE